MLPQIVMIIWFALFIGVNAGLVRDKEDRRPFSKALLWCTTVSLILWRGDWWDGIG